MARQAIPFVPQAYDFQPGTIRMSELRRRAAADQADLALRQGDISANLGMNLANIAGNVANAVGQYKADEPRRKAEQAATAKAGALDAAVRGAVDPATGKINSKRAAQDVARIDPLLAQQWWDRANEEEKIEAVKKGEKIKAIANVAGSLLIATQQMPPAERQDAYTTARQDLIGQGLATEEDIDPVYKPATLKAQVALVMTALEQWKQIEDAIKPPSTREVKTRNADGSETIQIVNDTPGQTFNSAAPVKEPKQYPVTVPGPNGPMQRLASEQEMSAGVPVYREPKAAPAAQPDQSFVIRGGVVTPIAKGTAQPGDVPYSADAMQGMGGEASDTRSMRVAAALNSIEKLKTLAPNRAPGLPGMIQGAGAKVAGLAGYNTGARQFDALLQPTAMQMAVAIQGAAGLSNSEREAMAKMLGNIATMDYESQMALLENASEMIRGGADVEYRKEEDPKTGIMVDRWVPKQRSRPLSVAPLGAPAASENPFRKKK